MSGLGGVGDSWTGANKARGKLNLTSEDIKEQLATENKRLKGEENEGWVNSREQRSHLRYTKPSLYANSRSTRGK